MRSCCWTCSIGGVEFDPIIGQAMLIIGNSLTAPQTIMRGAGIKTALGRDFWKYLKRREKLQMCDLEIKLI